MHLLSRKYNIYLLTTVIFRNTLAKTIMAIKWMTKHGARCMGPLLLEKYLQTLVEN